MISLPQMIASLREAIADFPDKRTGKNIQYTLSDAALGAFSVFFTQSPSFLAHQRQIQESLGSNNAHSLFGMIDIPTDNHIRDLLDEVSPPLVFPVFEMVFDALQQGGILDQFQVTIGEKQQTLLLALDGTEYHSSTKIHCDNCSTKEYKEGELTYSHGFITPAIVSPEKSQVIPLWPEYITPQDGDSKQDFEVKAGKRWLRSNGRKLSPLGITILGDDLYAHEPMCREILGQGFNFILVCKPDSHKTAYEWIRGITEKKRVTRWTGKYHEVSTYRWANQVPIRDSKGKRDHPLLVNFCEVEIVQEETGKVLYRNGFVTSLLVDDTTVEAIVAAGRARWKIENENINTLKTKGYHLEHNYGHGKKYLSQLLAAYALLAFLMHTVMDLTDTLYQSLRSRLGSRENFFNAIKQLTTFLYFRSWEHLFTFMIEGLKRRHLAPG